MIRSVRITGDADGRFHVHDANTGAPLRGVTNVTIELDAERRVPVAVVRFIFPEVHVPHRDDLPASS